MTTRCDRAWIHPCRFKLLARVLGVLLCLSMAPHPQQALSAALPETYTVTLAWDESNSASAAGYRLHYGTASANYTNSIAVGLATTSTITGLEGGVTYYFVVTSYDTNGLDGPDSNEISYTAPTGLPTVGMNTGANREVVLTVTGQIGLKYDILATQDFKTWIVIGAVTLGSSGSVDFVDTNAANFARRFYSTQQ